MKSEVWQRVLTGLIAGMMTTAVVAVGAGVGEDAQPARPDEVLGRTFERDSTDGARTRDELELGSGSVVLDDDLAETADPARGTFSREQADPPSASGPGPASPTPTTPPPAAPSTTSRPSGPPPSGRPSPGTRVVETSDTSGQFTYRDGSVSDATSTDRERGFVDFVLDGAAVDDHGRVTFTIVNRSGAAIRFPDGGINVKISITRPDGSVRVYEVRNPSVTSLPDGDSASGELDFPFVSDGTYKYAGEVLVEY